MILLLALFVALLFVTVSAVSDRGNEEAKATRPTENTVVHIPSTDAPTPTVSVTPEPEPERYILTEDVPLPFELQRVMQDACDKYGVPYALALAVAECESSFILEADNGTCWGLMQIHPINYPRLRENGIEPTEYEGNIVAGVFMLGELLEKYSDTHKALMAYNCGETGAKRLWNQGYFTSTYSRKVVTNYEKWQQIINK